MVLMAYWYLKEEIKRDKDGNKMKEGSERVEKLFGREGNA